MTLLLEYLDECTVRVTVLLEYLDCTFSICGIKIPCVLFYDSLICNPILLSLNKGYLLCLIHLHSNVKVITPCSLCDIGGNSIISKNQSRSFYQGWVKL